MDHCHKAALQKYIYVQDIGFKCMNLSLMSEPEATVARKTPWGEMAKRPWEKPDSKGSPSTHIWGIPDSLLRSNFLL